MPFIAVELDAIPKVSLVARSAGVEDSAVGWGLTLLWQHCWREKVTEITAAQMQGFFPAHVVDALVAFGFLEPQANGPLRYRVKGAERYLRVTAARKKGGQAAKDNLVPGGAAAAAALALHDLDVILAKSAENLAKASSAAPRLPLGSTANSEQRTAATEAETAPSAKSTDGHGHVPPDVNAPETPPADWDSMDFWRWAQETRREAAQLLPERAPHPLKLSGWWSAARMVAETQVLQDAFLSFGDDEYWQKQKPPLPFAGFMSQWERFVEGENAP